MPSMPKEAMPQEAAQPDMGKVVELAQGVGQGLAQLSEMLNSAPGTSDDERAQMGQILNAFAELVEKKLTGGAVAEEEPMPADPGAVPMEGGMKGQPMGPQSRM